MSKINNSDIVHSFESICNTAKLSEHVEPSKPWPRPEAKIDDGGPAFPLHYKVTKKSEMVVSFDGMTLRDYACIKLKVPETDKQWLNDIIIESLKNDFAAEAMKLYFDQAPKSTRKAERFFISKSAYHMANAMIEAHRGK